MPPGLDDPMITETRNLLVALAISASPVLAGDLVGPVTHVRDGDTFEVAGVPIRLDGLHAPEHDERFGREATAMMMRIVQGQQLSCSLTGARSHDRMIGTCHDEGGRDVARELVRAGLGRDCPRYSRGRYAGTETAWARQNLPLPSYCR